MNKITERRILMLDDVRLESGAHSPDGKFCVMELVAYVEGLAWSDSPPCTSPVIAAFLRRWNDGMNDADRQILKRFFTVDESGDVSEGVE